MAVNKVVMNTENGENTLIDLTSDTVTAETLAEGTTAHDASGNVITGVGKTTSVLYTAQTLTDEQKAQARANIGVLGPLVGDTSTITPEQVYAALMAGRPVAITHTDTTYGKMTFGYTSHSALIGNQIVSTIIFEASQMVFAAQLFGKLGTNTWGFQATILAKAEDIPTSLPNPNALTINGTAYDGSKAVDIDTSEFVITLTGSETDGFTSDKQYSDIVEAYESGRTLVCVWDSTRMPLVSFDNGMFQFMIAIPGFVTMAMVVDGSAAVLSMSSPITINDEVWTGEEPKDFTDTINAMIDAKAKKGESIYYIVGNGDTAGVWTGTCEDITEYYDGLTILFKLNVEGVSGGSTLNINGLGACAVKRNATTAVTTTYPAGSIVMLTYSGGVWFTADYDANTKTSAGTSNKVGTKMYLVGGTSQNSSGVTTYTNTNCYIGTDNRLYSNGAVVPNTDEINALIDAKLGVIENGSY